MTRALLPLLALAPALLRAQALPFHTETALTTAFEERAVRSFAMVGGRDNVRVGVVQLVVLPFAPHERVSTMVALPLVHKRMTSPASGGETLYSNTGVGDLSATLKWAFFARDRLGGTTRLAVMLSGRFPTGSTGAALEGGGVAPRPLQLGTGAFTAGATLVGTMVRGRWGISADVGHARSATGDGYRFGSVTRYDIAVGVRFPGYIATMRTKTLQLYLEWNGVVRGRDDDAGSTLPDTGGHTAFLGPGLQWVVLPQLLFEGSVQLPVIQNSDPRVALGGRWLFF